jgi:hypothetical protein
VRLRQLLLLAPAMLLTSCSSSHDGHFANPCDKPLTVRTYYVVRGTTDKSDDLIAEAVVKPLTVTKVDDAFQDASGFTWWVEIDGGPTFKVSKRTMPRWTVTIPASACGA